MSSQTYSKSEQGSSVSGFHDSEQSLSAITARLAEDGPEIPFLQSVRSLFRDADILTEKRNAEVYMRRAHTINFLLEWDLWENSDREDKSLNGLAAAVVDSHQILVDLNNNRDADRGEQYTLRYSRWLSGHLDGQKGVSGLHELIQALYLIYIGQ
jgi:hypothetical protein